MSRWITRFVSKWLFVANSRPKPLPILARHFVRPQSTNFCCENNRNWRLLMDLLVGLSKTTFQYNKHKLRACGKHKFHYIYRVWDLLSTCLKRVSDHVPVQVVNKSETCGLLVADMSLTNFLLKTCRRPGRRQVSDKIDVMEFGLKLEADCPSFKSLFTRSFTQSRLKCNVANTTVWRNLC